MATKEGEQCCEEMTLQDFKMWSEEALKHFLYVRMKSVEGDLETLIYRAMSAYEEKIPIDEEAERKSRVLLAEYKRKLVPWMCLILNTYLILNACKQTIFQVCNLQKFHPPSYIAN